MHKRRIATWVAGLALTTLVTTVAIGMPWDIDMANGPSVKAYEQKMRLLPEGVVSQQNILTPSSFVPNANRYTAAGKALTSPYKEDAVFQAMGVSMYDIYCDHCHGHGKELGPVADPASMPAILLFGKDGKGRAKTVSDGYIYLTIRNGSVMMPRHGYAMSEKEMWSVVRFIRRQEGGQFTPPVEQ